MHVRPLTAGDAGRIAKMQRVNYPPGLCDEEAAIRDVILSTDLSLGLEERGVLIGCIVAQFKPTMVGRDTHDGVIIDDIEILPAFQGRKLSLRLLEPFFAAARQRGLPVYLHARHTSYPIFSNRELLARLGYDVAHDELRSGFYRPWGADEDAHFMKLVPTH